MIVAKSKLSQLTHPRSINAYESKLVDRVSRELEEENEILNDSKFTKE